MTIKAVIFDIGGVVFGSPILGAQDGDKRYGLPSHYINAHITFLGEGGAFQRLERSELPLDEFYEVFGKEMSNVKTGNQAYEAYCRKIKIPCPKLPTELRIDGHELWDLMMTPALTPDPIILTAINALRASQKYKIAALTNNFTVPGAPPILPTPKSAHLSPTRQVSFEELRQSLKDAANDPAQKGAPTNLLKSLFDEFVESAVEGLRKPDPKFYQIALDKLGVKGDEAVFLDDIGRNLVAARKLGIHTIRVNPGQALEAVKELEKVVGIPLRGTAKL